MKIDVVAKLPGFKANQLSALFDLGEGRELFDAKAAKGHPGWKDLARRRKAEALKGEYLAVGEEPLLYLPAAAAKWWDDDEKVRILAAKAYETACGRGSARLIVRLDGAAGAGAAALAAEGIALRAYRFDKYKGGERKDGPAVTLVVPKDELEAARADVERAVMLSEATNRARDLVNEPGSVANPAEIERRARKLAKARGLKIEVLQEKDLRAQGYEGLLTVGRGSAVPPRMIVLKYAPEKKSGKGDNAVHLGLLGKGITFDTGGVSIKPGDKMWQMKGDMSGAAATLYAMDAIAELRLPVRVTAVIVTSQNYVDANSVVPGDIFRAKNGKTVMVDNTDAEGRLVLTDGMWRMGEEGVTHLIDIATLTGAVMRALGNAVSGAFGNDGFCDEVITAANACGEPCWRMPLIEEYRPWLDVEVADINNMSSVPLLAGATVAALFLREFLPEGVHWTHLDIAGTFIAEKPKKYYGAGGTGIMTRTLVEVARRFAGDSGA